MVSSTRHYFDMVILFTGKDFKIRYMNSVLGFVWSLLNPLAYKAILTLVFSLLQSLRTSKHLSPSRGSKRVNSYYFPDVRNSWNTFSDSELAHTVREIKRRLGSILDAGDSAWGTKRKGG